MIRAFACLVAAVMLAVSAPAAAEDSVLNKEGFWSVGRGEADSTSCFAALMAKSGELFMLRAENGSLDFSVGRDKPFRGRRAGLETDTFRLPFKPAFSRNGLLISEDLDEQAVTALRQARALVVRLDGREVFNGTLEGTGHEGALDAVIACSKGQSGWWGAGVAEPHKADIRGVLNAEGRWRVRANPEEASCTAYVTLEGPVAIVLVATDDGVSFGVSANRTLRRGREGVLATEGYTLAFRPAYDDNYLYLNDALGDEALAALRSGRELRISVDGRAIAGMTLEGTGVSGVLDSLSECVAGKTGWWGPGLPASRAAGAP